MYNRLLDWMAVAGAIILGLMAFWISYDVLMRKIFNAPTIWASDLSEYGLLWATFLGTGWLVREGGHVEIDILTSRLNLRWQHVFGVIGALIAAGSSAVMLWQGIDLTIDALVRGQTMARTWNVPRWLVWSIIPIGSFFLTIEWVRVALRSFRATRGDLGTPDHVLAEPAV